MYIIKQYTFDKLKKLNEKLKTDKITIKPSTVKNKKISIFINNNKIYDIGDSRYLDFPNYIEKRGAEYADERRRLYYIRHNKDPDIKNGAVMKSWWAKWLLW